MTLSNAEILELFEDIPRSEWWPMIEALAAKGKRWA